MTPDAEARFVGAFILVPLAFGALLLGAIVWIRYHETHHVAEARVFDGGP